MNEFFHSLDFFALGLVTAAIALAMYGLWKGYASIAMAGVEEHAREVIELMENPMAELGDEVEGVFEAVDCGRDEYPGDGLRLVLIASPTDPASHAPRPFNPDDGATTQLLSMLGLKDLRHGDEVRITAQLYGRARTGKERL